MAATGDEAAAMESISKAPVPPTDLTLTPEPEHKTDATENQKAKRPSNNSKLFCKQISLCASHCIYYDSVSFVLLLVLLCLWLIFELMQPVLEYWTCPVSKENDAFCEHL